MACTRVLLFLGLLWVSAGEADTVRHSSVTHDEGVYRIEMEMAIAADIDTVRAIITDYGNLDRISDLLTETELLEASGGDGIRRRLFTKICILFFCFDSVIVEDVETPGDDTVLTFVIPELSDFHSGRSYWHIRSLDSDRTLLRFRYVLEPDFWIPPIIGPLLIKRKLLGEAEATIEKIETLARER